MGRSSKPETAEQSENISPSAAPLAAVHQQTLHPGPAPSAGSAATDNSFGERPPATTEPQRATTEYENLARAIKDGVVGGFVGHTTTLSGEANFKGMLRVDGRLSGRVNSEKGTLIVSGGGQVNAEVNVAVAKVNGTINGDINTTERLELGRTARVVGNIQTPELIIEQGAIFEGGCRMTQRPAAPVLPSRVASATEGASGKPSATPKTASAGEVSPALPTNSNGAAHPAANVTA